MKIIIETIPYAKQRYPTLGDWYYRTEAFSHKKLLIVHVSETGDWRSDALIAIHELVEALLCRAAGVTQEQVDKFDIAFTGEGEPGDDPAAPYHHQHAFAMYVEKRMCVELNMDWSEHEERCDAVEERNEQVQARNPSLGQQEGTEGQEPQAGDSDQTE